MAHDEFSLIRDWTSNSAGQEGDGLSVGIGDDAAVFAVSAGMEVVVCCDAMIETIHFLRETMRPSDIGFKGMISNISDVAAMGGIPRFALVTIGIPPTWKAEECKEIYDGIYEAAKQYGVRLIGGDTVSTPDALHLSITLLGEVESGKALRRSAAKPGQVVFLTGPVGGSAAGLHLLLEKKEADKEIEPKWQDLLFRHRRPLAQVAAGRLLTASGAAGAVNDISDGLASELWEIAEASDVAIVVDPDRIPLDESVKEYAALIGKDPLDWALFGGEDYQLVGSVQSTDVDLVRRHFEDNGLSFYQIGQVEEGSADVMLKTDGANRKQLPKGGFNHFRG